MTEKPKKRKTKQHKGIYWQNAADAELNTSEWYGAIIRYFWNLGRRKFDTFYNQKELNKNARIGWFFKVFLLVILLIIGFSIC